MPKIDETAVLRRAKALCEQDGKLWEMEYRPAMPRGTKIMLKPILDGAGRREYIARARAELCKNSDGST